jgi:uncharacterized membrane protein (DUF485 family)
MLHEPAANVGKDPAFAFKRRLGVVLFLVYAAIYAAFVAWNLVRPASMGTVLFSGLNLAVVYGFGLIVLALILALAYNLACGRREAALAAEAGAKKGDAR